MEDRTKITDEMLRKIGWLAPRAMRVSEFRSLVRDIRDSWLPAGITFDSPELRQILEEEGLLSPKPAVDIDEVNK